MTTTTKGRDQSVKQSHETKVQNGKVKCAECNKMKECTLEEVQYSQLPDDWGTLYLCKGCARKLGVT